MSTRYPVSDLKKKRVIVIIGICLNLSPRLRTIAFSIVQKSITHVSPYNFPLDGEVSNLLRTCFGLVVRRCILATGKSQTYYVLATGKQRILAYLTCLFDRLAQRDHHVWISHHAVNYNHEISCSNGCITELADESVTDWHQSVISAHHPPRRVVIQSPTSQSTSPSVNHTSTSRQLVVVPANAPPQTDLGTALIADWLLTASFIYGLLSSSAAVYLVVMESYIIATI